MQARAWGPYAAARDGLAVTVNRHGNAGFPTLVDLSRFKVSPILTDRHFTRFSTCVPCVSGVSLAGVSLLSAEVAVVVVRPEVISQRVFISKGRTRAR
jgi:hypothetical protein